MNRFSNILLILCITAFCIQVSGCKPESVITPEITVSKEALSFTSQSSTATMAIKTNDAWTISSSQSWCTVTPSSGEAGTKQISVAVLENTLGVARQAILSVTVGSLTKQVTINQEMSTTIVFDKKSFDITSAGGDITVNLQAPSAYTATPLSSWITLKSTFTDTKIQVFTIAENTGAASRQGKILYTCGPTTDTIKVIQAGASFTIPADATGMSSTVTALAANIKLGINIGNTLEATGGETAWGNPLITKAYIDLLKQSGFNAVRLPCSWNQYLVSGSTTQIKPEWLERVKQVIQYCIDDNMYVILNIHWDGGWLENNCTVAKQAENNLKQKAFWEQIGICMRNFDEHLLFASANEPNVADATQMAVLLSYHQTFVNAVRSTGGKNAYRVLVVQGPSTDIAKTNELMTTLPTDNVANRMMVEIHYYTPWNFCGMTKDETWGNQFYYWGKDYHSTTDTAHNPTWGEESTVDTNMKLMKTQFVDKGIPVIMGEYGCILRTNLTGAALDLHKASRAYYFKYVTQKAKANGILPFYWEAGGNGALFNRTNNTVSDQQALTAIIQGGN